MISLRKTAIFWITESHFLFIGLFDWGNAETQTFSVSRNRDGFALAESWTRKSGSLAPLLVVACRCPMVYSEESEPTTVHYFPASLLLFTMGHTVCSEILTVNPSGDKVM